MPPFYQAASHERAQTKGELLTPLSAESRQPNHPLQPPPNAFPTPEQSGIGFQAVIAFNTASKPMPLDSFDNCVDRATDRRIRNGWFRWTRAMATLFHDRQNHANAADGNDEDKFEWTVHLRHPRRRLSVT